MLFRSYIPNYSGSTYKSLSIDGVTEDNVTSNTGPYASLYAGLWSNSAPINSITLYPNGSANFAQYSTFTLYGVKAMRTAVNLKAFGGSVTYDGTYVYHTFTSSGTFTA